MRGPVISRILSVPMRIEVQQEPDGSWVAVKPGYIFTKMIAEGQTQQEACRNLEQLIRGMTGAPT